MASILVIEDDAETAREIADELRVHGHTVHAEADGQNGLERALREPFDAITLPLMQTASGALAFVAPSGARIEMAGEGFANWVLWSRPGAGYLCIEPWTGQGDPVGFAGEISDKPGMILLPPGARRSHAVTMRFMNAGI